MERALFGRQTELALVSELLDGVPTGPVVMVLGGEASIGKSSLWLEALSRARARSYRVLSSRPTESEAKLSFAALGDLLDGVAEEGLEDLPPPQRSALEVALLRREATESALDQRAVASAFLGALSTLASAGPSVVCLRHRPCVTLRPVRGSHSKMQGSTISRASPTAGTSIGYKAHGKEE
jgi:hypothetical protein